MPTGSNILLAEGTYTFRLHPYVELGPFGSTTGELLRSETFEVLIPTTDFGFEWLQMACTPPIIDAVGVVVPGSTFVLPAPYPAASLGDLVTFPVTRSLL